MLVPKLHVLRAPLFQVAATLLTIGGCSSSGTSGTSVTHPTMIEVSPEAFLGDVPCANDGAGLKRYVATLYDINYVASADSGGSGGASSSTAGAGGTMPQPDVQLPSSPPTRCGASVGFGYVYPEHRYRVEIDGFDTDDLRPRALGARQMIDAERNVVEPTWSVVCEEPVVAVDSTIVRAGLCSSTFELPDPSAPGGLIIELSELLGNLRCGTDAGQVDHFDVTLTAAGSEPVVQTVPCAADARATFTDLPPGLRLSAYVAAFGADVAAPFAGASCSARTIAASDVAATCEALNQTGTVRVDLVSALSQLDLTCTGSDLRLDVTVPDAPAPPAITPPGCLQPLDVGFAPGPAALTITASRVGATSASELGSVTCHAEVTPGQLVSAQCEPNRVD